MKTTTNNNPTGGTNKENEYYSRKDDFNTFTKDQTFSYCVMPGNYPATMRAVMSRRLNWTEVSDTNGKPYRSRKKMQWSSRITYGVRSTSASPATTR